MSLTHWYTFNDGTGEDLVGQQDIALVGGVEVVGGEVMLQNRGVESGGGGLQYLDLPVAALPADGAATIEVWFSAAGAEAWSRLFDFGSQSGALGDSYLFYTPRSSFNDSRLALSTGGGAGGERVAEAATSDNGQQRMVAAVVDAAADTLRLYVDGALVATEPLAGADLGDVTLNAAYFGRSLYNTDPGFTGAIDEVRLYDEARTPEAIAATHAEGPVPGPDPYPENPVVLPRQVERLDRGLVAMRRSASEAYLGWRLLGDDPTGVAFNVYRAGRGGVGVKLNAAPLTATTDFVDTTANLDQQNTYFVRPVVDGVELAASKTFTLPAQAPIQQYFSIPLQIPDPVTTPDGVTHYYTANDASVGDLDGDGDYEVILKWTGEPADLFAPSARMYVDAYDLSGELLWRIDVGPNVKTIASSLQFIVYDFDGDGRAEVAMNTSDGAVSGTGQVIGDPGANWVNPDGWITTGPEYLTIFDGQTGAVLANTPLAPARGGVADWGDNYGHRSTTHKYVVAYLDGQRPSLVTGRGIYHGQAAIGRSKTELVAWDFRDGQLTQRWTFTATEGTANDVNPEYVGQGNQAVSVADVDGDGFDEVIWGAMVVDHDGGGLYSTGRGHGDALHVSDMDPDNPGLEIFEPHESPSEYGAAGGDYRDAMTGELLYGIPTTGDVGRGVAFDIDPNYPGYEFWTSHVEPGNSGPTIYNVQAGPIYEAPANVHINFGVWWDADPLRETLDGATISKWRYDWANPGRQNIVWYGANGINNNSGAVGNNGTKENPALVADLFGDWREEVIWRLADSSALQVWSTTISSTMRIPTLMHDIQYREAVAWQNVYYNQPPHPSYFLGAGMAAPPTPPLFFGGELAGDYNRDNVVDLADYTVWRDSLGSQTILAADGSHNGVVDIDDYHVWRDNFGATGAAAFASGSPSDYSQAAGRPVQAVVDEAAVFSEAVYVSGENNTTSRVFAEAPSAPAIDSSFEEPSLLLLIEAEEEENAEGLFGFVAPDETTENELVDFAFEGWRGVVLFGSGG